MKAWFVRTFVPLLVGFLLALSAKYGLGLDGPTATIVATSVITGAYATIARLIERKAPRLGRLLMALGLVKEQPKYSKP